MTRREDGFTLVELLVVMLLLGVTGSIVVSGLVTSMRSTNSTQVRIEAMAEMQRSIERVTREVRAACPVMEMSADDLTVEIHRDGDVRYHQFFREGGQLRHAIKDDPEAVPEPSMILARDVPEDGELFTYEGLLGETENPRDVRVVEITLQRSLPDQDQPVQVSTSITLRNGGQACG